MIKIKNSAGKTVITIASDGQEVVDEEYFEELKQKRLEESGINSTKEDSSCSTTKSSQA